MPLATKHSTENIEVIGELLGAIKAYDTNSLKKCTKSKISSVKLDPLPHIDIDKGLSQISDAVSRNSRTGSLLSSKNKSGSSTKKTEPKEKSGAEEQPKTIEDVIIKNQILKMKYLFFISVVLLMNINQA